LVRKVDEAEVRLMQSQPDKKLFHLCIVNLVIGYARLTRTTRRTSGPRTCVPPREFTQELKAKRLEISDSETCCEVM